jgi:hypothetical protein
MPTPSGERRRSKRISYPCEVRGYALGASLVGAHLTDLSAGGAFVEMNLDLAERTVLLLKFRIDDVNVKVEGMVVRTDPPRGVAVRFVNLAPAHRDAIKRAIEKH